MLVALYALLLSACADTAVEYSAPLCGGTGAALSVADFEDRAFASSIVEIRTKRDSGYGNFLTIDPHERWGGKHHKLTRGYAIQCAA
jgi:hypothetical protein